MVQLPLLPTCLAETLRPTWACRMLAASDASSALTLWYMDELRLNVGRASSSGGSLKGEPSTGLTGAESANGFLTEDAGVSLRSMFPTMDP